MNVYSVSFEAPKIPFRPNQCPNCKNYENKQCTAYTERKQLPFGTSTVTLAAVFKGESQEPCPKYASNSNKVPSTKTTSSSTDVSSAKTASNSKDVSRTKTISPKKWWEFWKRETQPAASTAANAGATPVDTSAINSLLEQPYGAVLPISVNHSGRIVTAFIFRESKDRIAELAHSSALKSMHTKAAFIEVSGVILYVILFKIGDQVFETWWNWHNPVIRPLFESLFEQKEIVVGFVSDEPEIGHIVRYPSAIQDGLQANRSKLNTARSWTMDAFDKARAAVEQQYPTPVSFWKANGG